MNMITVLLGATGLLLAIAVAMSIGSMRNDNSADKIAALEAELKRIEAGEAELIATSSANLPLTPATAPVPGTITDPIANPGFSSADLGDSAIGRLISEAEVAEKEIEIAEKEAEIADLEAEVVRQTKKANIANMETEMFIGRAAEQQAKFRRDAKKVTEAIAMARVVEWVPKDGFVVIEILRRDLVQNGEILGIRRGSGVLGQVKISRMYPEEGQAVADPIPSTFPGPFDIQVGDELILTPSGI